MYLNTSQIWRNKITSSLGAIFVSTGIFLLLTSGTLVEILMNAIMAFTPDSQLFQVWVDNDIPTPLDFYMFNWTNPQEINDFSTKPKFEQLGPYRFQQKTTKVGMVWNDNETITYRHHTRYYFDGNFTERSLKDEINTINPMAVSAAYVARNWGYMAKRGLSFTLRTIASAVHITKSVGELLFDGYEDSILNIKQTFPFLASSDLPEMEKFAWFGMRNNSQWFDGVMNMGTARHNFGLLKNWNYQSKTKFHEGHCGKVQGSAGQLYQKPITKEKVTFFSTDLCRYVSLDFDEEVTINSIRGYKFSFGKSFLDNGTKVPENSCFCTGECVPSGVKNISNCRYGTPSFASLPNFYKADPFYLDSIDGVHPDKDLHDSYMIFEPSTGIPLKVNMALQINLLLQPIKYITLYQEVPRVFVPVLWFRQTVQMPDDLLMKLYVLLKLPLIINMFGCLLIFLGLSLFAYLTYKSHNEGNNNKRYKMSMSFQCPEAVPLKS